jgi:hypothetical protein
MDSLNINSNNDSTCAICFETLKTENPNTPVSVVTLPCHHTHCFHVSCLKGTAIGASCHRCPLCRALYPPELVGDIIYDNDYVMDDSYDNNSYNNNSVVQESYIDDLVDEGIFTRNTDTDVVPDSQPTY